MGSPGDWTMGAVRITRTDLDAKQLRATVVCETDARQARRILGIAMVLDGHSRALSAQAAGMDRQTLCDWIHRYNAEGVSGLSDRPRPGRPTRLTPEQMQELSGWVEKGPDLKDDGVVRWRCADLRDKIVARFAVTLHERSVGKLLDKLDFSSVSARPLHPQSDLEAQETFKKTLPISPVRRSRRNAMAGRSRFGGRMKRGSVNMAH
jgi:transposase